MLQELIVALNPAQNTNGYTFRRLEHLLEKSLTKAVPRAIPVYIFVDAASNSSKYTEVEQFLAAVQAAQTRHPNVTVVLGTTDTSPVDNSYTRVAVPAITVGDVKELAKRVAKTQARHFADGETLAHATAYALWHPEPLDRITNLIRMASALTTSRMPITTKHLDIAQTRLEFANLDTAITPVIRALPSPNTGHLLIQAAAAITRNGHETFSIAYLNRVISKLNDDVPIDPELVTKTLNTLTRNRIFNTVGKTRVTLPSTLTKPHTLVAITDMWDPLLSEPQTTTQNTSTPEEILDLHLTYIAIQVALVKLERTIPFLEVPTQNTLYPIYLEACTDLNIHPKTPTKVYAALAKLHQKNLITVARDPSGQGRPNLITSALTKTQTGALTRHYRRLAQSHNQHNHYKNLDAIKASIETSLAHASSQKTIMACILDLSRKLGKNTLRKLDIYSHYCSTCTSTPIKQESFWAILTKLITLRSLISSIRCFFGGCNEARILIFFRNSNPPRHTRSQTMTPTNISASGVNAKNTGVQVLTQKDFDAMTPTRQAFICDRIKECTKLTDSIPEHD